MIKKTSSKTFFIIIGLIILFTTFLRHPSLSRQREFYKFQSYLKNDEFDPEEYWQFRERFSPGNFIRNEKNTDFFATFRITSVEDNLTPLFFYESKYLNSLDSLVSSNPDEALGKFKKEFEGETVSEGKYYALIKQSEKNYVFGFVESIDEMKRVNGLFDYKKAERELIKDKYWYNITYLTIK